MRKTKIALHRSQCIYCRSTSLLNIPARDTSNYGCIFPENGKNHNNMSLTCALVHREYLEVVGHDPHILDHIAGQMYARADARFISKIMKIRTLRNVCEKFTPIIGNTHAQNYFSKFGQYWGNISLWNTRHIHCKTIIFAKARRLL